MGTLPQDKAKEVVEDFLIAHKHLTISSCKMYVENDIIYFISDENEELKKINEAGGEGQKNLETRQKEEMAAAGRKLEAEVSTAYDEKFFGKNLDAVTKKVIEDLADEGTGITKDKFVSGFAKHMVAVSEDQALMERFNKKVAETADAAINKIITEFLDDGLGGDEDPPQPRKRENCCVDLFV